MIRDWKAVGPAPESMRPEGEIAVRIEITAEEANDMRAIATEVARDARRMIEKGEGGVFEAQWCNSAARITIARKG